MELAGLLPGTQYDHLDVGGSLTICGTLNVVLLDGFTPALGQSFDILDWGAVAGTFATLSLPTLPGLTWDTTQLYTAGVLKVNSAGIAGDYNNNGTVDAADYVVWRKGLGTTYPPSNYDDWRTYFGHAGGESGSAAAVQTSVPEPNALLLIALPLALLVVRHRHTMERLFAPCLPGSLTSLRPQRRRRVQANRP